MISCIAIDDEPLALEVLKKYIAQTPGLHLANYFSDAIEAQDYLKKNPVDLLLLDIQMPDINGMQFYKELTVKPMVIFTTAFKEYAVDGFDADAIDYLLKPFNLARFQKGINKAVLHHKLLAEENKSAPIESVYIHADYKVIKISCKDIIYIEALDDYIRINTPTQSYLTLLSMKLMMDKLPKDQFVRIHRSYIVSLSQISFIQFRKIGLLNNMELPVGDTYRTEVVGLKKQGI